MGGGGRAVKCGVTFAYGVKMVDFERVRNRGCASNTMVCVCVVCSITYTFCL